MSAWGGKGRGSPKVRNCSWQGLAFPAKPAFGSFIGGILRRRVAGRGLRAFSPNPVDASKRLPSEDLHAAGHIETQSMMGSKPPGPWAVPSSRTGPHRYSKMQRGGVDTKVSRLSVPAFIFCGQPADRDRFTLFQLYHIAPLGKVLGCLLTCCVMRNSNW